MVFIYKRNKQLIFLDLQKGLQFEDELLNSGYTHISTVDYSIILSRIWAIMSMKYSDFKKCELIKELLEFDEISKQQMLDKVNSIIYGKSDKNIIYGEETMQND